MVSKRYKYLMITIIGIVLLTSPVTIHAKEVGFAEVSVEKINKDKLHTYRYAESNIKVIWIENKDINKAFTLGVKTPTTDSSGVNHIIEHTLFTGSDKYKSPSVFFDASEAYPSTYMNALTSSDMTMFPFSTPYDSCYSELLDIYLDAIFNPDFLNQPYGFYEESFYNSPSEDRIGGVVYNEMKGACAGKDRIIFRGIRSMVLKGTGYEYDSGGEPNEIPKLTYNEFINTYNRYYYPDNMCIVMYGDICIKNTLNTIEQYLKDAYNKSLNNTHIIKNDTTSELMCKKDIQETGSSLPVNLCDIQLSDNYKDSFNVLPSGSEGCIIKSFVFDKQLTSEEEVKLDLWMKAYVMNPKTGLQKKLILEGFKNVRWMKDNEIPCPIYSMIVSDIDEDKIEEANVKLQDIIDNIYIYIKRDSFIEQDVIDEAKWEISHIEMDINRGVELGQSILDAWAHNKSLTQYYEKSNCIRDIQEIGFEGGNILGSYNNVYTLFLTEGEYELISPELLTSISDDQWDKEITQMKDWQKVTIDMKDICIDELVIKPTLKTNVNNKGIYTTLVTPISGEFARSNLYIDTSHIKQVELPYLYLYSYLLKESAQEITPFSGTISTKCTAYENPQSKCVDDYTPYFKISILTKSTELDHHILLNEARASLKSKGYDWYRNKLLSLISEMKDSTQNNAISTLSEISLGSEEGVKRYLYEQGYPFYEFCQECAKDDNGKWCFIVKYLDNKIYHSEGLILGLATPKDIQNKYESRWEVYLKDLPERLLDKQKYDFQIYSKSSVIKTNAIVDEAYIGIEKKGAMDGIDYVVATYLTKHYLTPNIRVGLGAYGAGCGLSYPHTVSMYTYRDPDAETSIEIMKGAFNFLEKEMSDNIMKKTKVEALNKFQMQFGLIGTELEKAAVNENLILLGQTPKVLEKIQKEIIGATTKSIVVKGKIYNSLIKDSRCAIMTRKDYVPDKTFSTYKY